MKSLSALLFTAGLVSAVAVPAQLAERAAGLLRRQEAAPAPTGQPAEVQQPANATISAVSTTTISVAPTETQQNQQEQNKGDQNKGDQNQNKGEQNKGDQNQNKGEQNKGNNGNNNNNDKNRNKNNNNRNKNNNNDINIIIQQGIQQGNLLQGLFTPAITGILGNMGLGNNINVQSLQGLSFANQLVVLNQLQQLQTLMQLNIVQRQQAVTVVGKGFSNNGVNIGKSISLSRLESHSNGP
jgi:hypothetical protein